MIHMEPAEDDIQDESDRQAMLLAIAMLSVERPGWHYMLGRIADRLHGRDIYEKFRGLHGPMPGEGDSPGADP